MNIFKTKTGLQTYQYLKETMNELLSIRGRADLLANINQQVRSVMASGKEVIQLHRANLPLNKKTITLIMKHVASLERLKVEQQQKSAFNITISRKNEDGKRAPYFNIPYLGSKLDGESLAVLAYDALCLEVDIRKSTVVNFPTIFNSRTKKKVVAVLANKKLVREREDGRIEMLNPATGESLPEEDLDLGDDAAIYFKQDGVVAPAHPSNFTLDDYDAYFTLRAGTTRRGQNTVLCTFHEDATPSLSINTETCQYYCHACGATGNKMVSFEMELQNKQRGSSNYEEAIKDVLQLLGKEVVPDHYTGRGKVTETYVYTKADGENYNKFLRYEDRTGGWEHWVINKWVSGKSEGILYRLPEVLASDVVIITEGENKAEAVRALGLTYEDKPVAVTTTGSWNTWLPQLAQILRNKKVIVFPDNDVHGKKYLKNIETSCAIEQVFISVVWFTEYGKDVRALLDLHDTIPAKKKALLKHVEKYSVTLHREEAITI